jgi:hypothetical protein
MKKSEYLEKYGFDIPFAEKELSLVGKDLQFCKGNNDEIEKEGIVTNLRFGDCTFIKNGKKYLTVQFAIGDWWSREFPTEILSPPIYIEHTNDLVKESISIIKNENNSYKS